MAKIKIEIKPSIKRLNLVFKGLTNNKFMGNYASAFKGRGLEFSEYRSYTPNDDASLIDWKASNRARKLLVKEFIEERNLNVIFLVDVSSKMMIGSKKLKGEYIAELIASLSYMILESGDCVGLTMFSDKIIKSVPSGNGLNHFHIISSVLSNTSFYGGSSNIKKALDYAIKSFEEKSLLFLISDFIGCENFSQELRLTSKKFDLIGIMVRDIVDVELPDGVGQVHVEDPVTGERMLISPSKLKRAYSLESKKEISSFKKLFQNSGASFLQLYTNKSFVNDLIIFFKRRESEWR